MIKKFAKRFSERGPAFWWTGLPALIASGTIFILFATLVIESVPVFRSQGISFLWGTDWFAGEAYGALPMIFGSLMVTGLADVPRGYGRNIQTRSVVYIAETSSGQVGAYAIPWNQTFQSARKMQTGSFLAIDKLNFQTAPIRD